MRTTMKSYRLYLFLAIASVFLLSSFAIGQAVYGNIIGTVNDPSGAAVRNATVTITDVDRGNTYTADAHESGNCEHTHLLAVRYKVKVSAAGVSAFDTTAK